MMRSEPSPAFSIASSPALSELVGVVPQPADHGVVRRIAADPGQAVVAAVSDQVVADAVAGERVVARVADRPGRAGVEDERLEAVGEHVGRQARAHRVEAAAERLADEIAGVVDRVGVVAEAAEHVVGAPAPDERVVAVAADEAVVGRVAGDDVVELVADAVPGRRALDEQEVLDVGGQGEADLSGPDGVGAAAGLLDNRVGRIDVHVDVVIIRRIARIAGATPPWSVSAPGPPIRTSWPSRPMSVSLPPPPTSRSRPRLPVTVSLPVVGV